MTRMSVDERREKLVEAALAVMSRNGVADTTTRAIVAEAGMQIGVFHYCFRSKEELMREVIKAIDRRGVEAVTAVVGSSADPAELSRRWLEAYWAHVVDHPLIYQLFFELMLHTLRHPGEQVVAIEQYNSYLAGMERFFTSLGPLGARWRMRTDLVARMVLATLEGITMQWLIDRDDDNARLMLEELIDLVHRNAGLQDQG